MGSSSMATLVTKIWAKEGIIGFGRGFSAAFYGGLFSGFSYFYLYKHFKQILFEKYSNKIDVGWLCLLASFGAEFLTLIIKYPFDLVKCRLQSVNAVFKYKNLFHAFRKEIKTNGVLSLYEGVTPFLATYCTFVALQFSIYEKMLDYYKKSRSVEQFKTQELRINCFAGFAAGSIGSALTNGLEAVTVAKQTNPETKIMEMIREDGLKLLTRGLPARVVYNGGQSLVFFNLVLYIGKLFDVELSDD
jgi:solute carrier family 25 phosphate transporter 3